MNDFEHLKALLLQDTEKKLHTVQQRIDNPESRYKDIADVLPQAIKKVVQDQPEALKSVLQTPINDCMETALTQAPKRFAKPLLPVMTQAIRNNFADIFKSLRTYLHEQQQQINKQTQIVNELEQQLITQQQQQQDLKNHITQQQQYLQSNKQQLQGNNQQHKLLYNEYIAHKKTTLQLQEQLKKRITDIEQQAQDMTQRTRELAQILPSALQLAQKHETENNSPLSDSLKAPIEEALRQSIEKDTKTLANALFPIMGPAIRKAIEESFKALLNQVNDTVEQSMSINGIFWRYESIRTGKPFAQVMLQHTLIYRVEQIFLIHKSSGLLMQHLHQHSNETNTDADAVSAMLTAIQDFIQDSFSNDKSDELNTVEMGKYTLWLERGPYTVLACVIQGIPPYEFRIQLRETQEVLHQRYSQRLEQFEGDSDEIAITRPVLASMLQEKLKKTNKNQRINFLKKLVFWSLLLSAIVWSSSLQYEQWQQRQAGKVYVNKLQQTAGIVVIDSYWKQNIFYIRGLRDPLAKKPATIALALNFDHRVQYDWSNYQDHHQNFKLERLQIILKNYQWPKSITAKLIENTLYLEGQVEAEILVKLKQHLSIFNDIKSINTDKLLIGNRAERFHNYLEKLNETAGIMVLNSGQKKGSYFIKGIRDPLAIDPKKLIVDYQLKNIQSQWQPYYDLSPEFILKRIKQQLSPPSTVTLSLESNILMVIGHAEAAWIKRLHSLNVVGIEAINATHLNNTDELLLNQAQQQLQAFSGIKIDVNNKQLYLTGYMNHIEKIQLNKILIGLTDFSHIKQNIEAENILRKRLINEIKTTGQIYFSGGSLMLPGQENILLKLSQQITLILELNRYLKQPLILQLTGHTDQVGELNKNIGFSRNRAESIQKKLIKLGIAKQYIRLNLPDYLQAGKKIVKANRIRLQQRRVNFLIIKQTQQ